MTLSRLGAEMFTAPLTDHGEGPVWLAGYGLAVLDMLAGDIVLVSAAGAETARHHIGPVAAALRQRSAGGFVAGTERGFALLRDDFSLEQEITCWDDPAVRMNDGAADPQGRFWCGSMAYDFTPQAGALWRLDPDRTVTRVVDGVTCSNGLAWTPDGAAALYIDSPTHRVDRLALQPDGSVARREPFADLTGQGLPDGLAIDAAGGVWVALFAAGRLVHLDPAGRVDAEVLLPVAQVTACCFGGDGAAQLFVTTSRYGLDDPEPEAGAVFVVEPAVGGFAAPVFGG